MPNYRRYRVPGGTYFFTVNLLERRSSLLIPHIDALRESVRATRRKQPFHIDAWVVLPDHLHCNWTLPPGDDDFSNRWKAIKIRFVRSIPATERRSNTRIARNERIAPNGNGKTYCCMPNYRRVYHPGGTYFFTIKLLERTGNEATAIN